MQTEEQMPKENGMSVEEAIRILHPDTTLEALTEIEYYAGFKGKEAQIKAVEQACLIACEALEKQIQKEPTNLKTEGENHISGFCPICYTKQHYFPNGRGLYCDNCGQKLKWRDYDK